MRRWALLTASKGMITKDDWKFFCGTHDELPTSKNGARKRLCSVSRAAKKLRGIAFAFGSFGRELDMAEMFGIGDMVWSCIELRNDGTIPEMPADALLASAGARGVVVKTGTIQDHPEIGVYLVRFEDHAGVLGPPVGCLAEELTQDEQLAKSFANGIGADGESAADTTDTTAEDAPAHNG
ncbi:MAG: hypothetical protein RL701_4413 [Pseudomonadota bacterium]|jgi:nitrogen fixation protein NifZ